MSNINNLVLEAFNFPSNIGFNGKEFIFSDLPTYYDLLFKTTKSYFDIEEFYTVGHSDNKTYLLHNKKHNDENPNLLIVSGIHGEEIGGPYGILYFLNTINPAVLNRINLTIIPIINPSGFRKNNRQNLWNGNTNTGFIKRSKKDGYPSKEGRSIIKNINLLSHLGKDGCLSLHEDGTRSKFYLYLLGKEEDKKENFSLANKLLNVGKDFFDVADDGPVNVDRGDDFAGNIKDGIIYNLFDGTFEEYIFRNGAKVSICTEVPQQRDIQLRSECCAVLIKTFINKNP